MAIVRMTSTACCVCLCCWVIVARFKRRKCNKPCHHQSCAIVASLTWITELQNGYGRYDWMKWNTLSIPFIRSRRVCDWHQEDVHYVKIMTISMTESFDMFPMRIIRATMTIMTMTTKTTKTMEAAFLGDYKAIQCWSSRRGCRNVEITLRCKPNSLTINTDTEFCV